jgi:hypothetical protein
MFLINNIFHEPCQRRRSSGPQQFRNRLTLYNDFGKTRRARHTQSKIIRLRLRLSLKITQWMPQQITDAHPYKHEDFNFQ